MAETVFARPEALADVSTHYCPGCTHGVIHRLVAEVIDELARRAGVGEQVSAITEQAMRQTREVNRRDREAQADLAREVKKQIVAILEPEQVEQFEQPPDRC